MKAPTRLWPALGLLLTAACTINIGTTGQPSASPRPTLSPGTPFPSSVSSPTPSSAQTPVASVQPTATPTPLATAMPSFPPGPEGVFIQAAGCPEASGANLIANGGFETPIVDRYSTLAENFTGWTFVTGSYDLVDSTFWQPAAGDQSLDLSGFNGGTLYQTLNTEAGKAHRLTFCLAGNPNAEPIKKLSVSWNDVPFEPLSVDVTGKSYTNMGWVAYTIVVPASKVTANSKLTLTSLTQNAYGPTLDNVSVYPVN